MPNRIDAAIATALPAPAHQEDPPPRRWPSVASRALAPGAGARARRYDSAARSAAVAAVAGDSPACLRWGLMRTSGGSGRAGRSHWSRSRFISPSQHVPTSQTLSRRARHVAWAELLRRTFGLDVLACPDCGGRLRLVATIADPRVIARILAPLGLPPAPPRPCPGAANPAKEPRRSATMTREEVHP